MPAICPYSSSRCHTAWMRRYPKTALHSPRRDRLSVIETARRLSRTGADVLKLEAPHDIAHNQDEAAWQAACEQVSAASAVPWALLSAGWSTLRNSSGRLRVACAAGASGFLAGARHLERSRPHVQRCAGRLSGWRGGAATGCPAGDRCAGGSSLERLLCPAEV